MASFLQFIFGRTLPSHGRRHTGRDLDSPSARPPVQYMSDLHLEAIGYRFAIPSHADVLILAGDIGNAHDRAFHSYLQDLCTTFQRVLLIPGNHEYYHMVKRDGAAAEMSHIDERLTWMDRRRVHLFEDQVIVLGCTLHSNIRRSAQKLVQKQIKDFSYTDNWSIQQHNAEHKQDVKWLKRQLAIIQGQWPEAEVIIATHYPPTSTGTSDAKFANDWKSSYFASDILEQAQRWRGGELIRTWIFGHTHHNIRCKVGNLMLISNARQRPSGLEFDIQATI